MYAYTIGLREIRKTISCRLLTSLHSLPQKDVKTQISRKFGKMQSTIVPALVTASWLQDFIAKTKKNTYKILDGSWHLPQLERDAHLEFSEAHIPGAQFFDIDECADKTKFLPHMMPTVEVFEDYVSNLGINNDTHVIVYDNNTQLPLFSAPRVWLTFRIFGHAKVSVLEGGLMSWIANGGPVTNAFDLVEREEYKATFNSHKIKQMQDIMDNLKNPQFQLVDARSEGRFQGIAPEPRTDTKPGCIPQSTNLPFTKLLNTETMTMRSKEELSEIFKNAGVDLRKPVVFTCGSGSTACVLALGSYLLERDNFALYDGSWTEWYRDAPPELKLNVPE